MLNKKFRLIGVLATLALGFATIIADISAQNTGWLLYTTADASGINTIHYQAVDGTAAGITAVDSLIWAGNWSPDRSELLINRQVDGKGRIYRHTLDTGEEVEIAGTDAHYYAPVWSPAGALVAVAEEIQGYSRLLLLDLRSMQHSVLYDGFAVFNTWSPDGRHAIITVNGQPLIVDVANGTAVRLEIDGFGDTSIDVTDWHGDRVAFTHIDNGREAIFIAGIDGTNPQRAVQDASNHRWLRWTEDGTRFVFVSERDSLNGDIYMAADGEVERLTFTGGTNRIESLAYGVPRTERSVETELPARARFAPMSALLDDGPTANISDPVSAAYRALELMLSGTLASEAEIVCADYREMYMALSDSIRAGFEVPDLSGIAITLVETGAGWARVRLSGEMSLRAAGNRTVFPASLIPVYENAVQDLLLVYEDGWKICTPL